MAGSYARTCKSNICQYLLGLVLLMYTSAVHVPSPYMDQNLNFELVPVGEFKFCKRSNSTESSSAKCKNAGRSYSPENKNPSVTALMVGVMKSLQWVIGLSDDWVSACLVTAEFKFVPCECGKDRRPDPLTVLLSAFGHMMKHPTEAYVFTTYLQNDIYVRTKVLDSILSRVVTNTHIDQAVFLGTGFDSRPYRTGAGMEKVQKIFETDLEAGNNLKRAVLEKCEIQPIRGKGQVRHLHVNMIDKKPFEELWHHKSFTKAGHTLFVAEQIYAYLDVFDNMHWLTELRDSVISSGGTALLVLMATSGPNFDTSVYPRCYNSDECLLSQMPKDLKKANSYMHALGWEKVEGYGDLEAKYHATRMSGQDFGYLGVFRTGQDFGYLPFFRTGDKNTGAV